MSVIFEFSTQKFRLIKSFALRTKTLDCRTLVRRRSVFVHSALFWARLAAESHTAQNGT